MGTQRTTPFLTQMLQLHFVRMAPFTGLGVLRERLHCNSWHAECGIAGIDTHGVIDEAAMATAFVDGEV